MVDIHSHILYGVDDGAQTIDDSIKLIDEMVESGITKFILTPHRRKGMFEETKEKVDLRKRNILYRRRCRKNRDRRAS